MSGYPASSFPASTTYVPHGTFGIRNSPASFVSYIWSTRCPTNGFFSAMCTSALATAFPFSSKAASCGWREDYLATGRGPLASYVAPDCLMGSVSVAAIQRLWRSPTASNVSCESLCRCLPSKFSPPFTASTQRAQNVSFWVFPPCNIFLLAVATSILIASQF